MPIRDDSFRATLLDFFVETAPGPELSEWLRVLGQNPQGTVAEKRQRVKDHTAYLTMPVEGFPEQTQQYLSIYSSEDLAELCEILGLAWEGTRDTRYRRILREVGFREGWLQRPPAPPIASPTVATVRPFVEWYPITKRGAHEQDYYEAFADEMAEVFSEEVVHPQLPTFNYPHVARQA